MRKIKIFTCYHKEAPFFSSEIITPIHVGKALSNVELGIIGDNTGDNISHKNKSYCELTAIYWMWKNIDADYYGLFHYRRFLNFKSIGGGYDIFTEFSEENIRNFGWSDSQISSICEKYDVITSPVWNIHPVGLPNLQMTNYDFYAKEHFSKDLDIVIRIIKEKYPEIYPFALKSLYSKECFFANMMIMKREIFFEYCNWIFTILGEAEKEVDISNYDSYQYRIWGFIAERLSNCYLEYIKAIKKDLNYTGLGMVFGIFDKNKLSLQEIELNINKNRETSRDFLVDETVNIVFAIDNNYAKYCAVAIQSILDNVNINQKVKIFIVHDETFSEQNKALLKDNKSFNVFIEFLKVNLDDFLFYPLNREHISIATYYRLSLQKLLPKDVNKIIYLDSDIIVLDNIAKLWSTDLEDYYLAGSPDEGGILQIRRLGLPLSHNYINAGICLMNIAKMRTINLDHLYTETLYKNYDLITLQDQDILNIAFVNKIKRLHLRWNVQSRMYKQNELEYAYSYNELVEATKTPGIVHFSDRQKPWQSACQHTLKPYYKYYADKLPDELKIQKEALHISNFISYEILGSKSRILVSFKDFEKSFTINTKFAKFVYTYIKKLASLFK